MLLVSPDDATAVDRAFAAGADAVVVDLARGDRDPAARAAARASARDIVRTAQFDTHRPHLYLRLDDLDHEAFETDLATIMVAEPDGILLARCRSGMDVQQLGAKLAVQEAEHGLTDGETGIIAEAGATARALFMLGTYGDASPRLVGLTWHAERIASELGIEHDATPLHDVAPLHTVRHMTLFAARAAEVTAIDTAETAHDDAAFHVACVAARRQGFNAKLALDPAQIAIINAVFDRA